MCAHSNFFFCSESLSYSTLPYTKFLIVFSENHQCLFGVCGAYSQRDGAEQNFSKANDIGMIKEQLFHLDPNVILCNNS